MAKLHIHDYLRQPSQAVASQIAPAVLQADLTQYGVPLVPVTRDWVET